MPGGSTALCADKLPGQGFTWNRSGWIPDVVAGGSLNKVPTVLVCLADDPRLALSGHGIHSLAHVRSILYDNVPALLALNTLLFLARVVSRAVCDDA
jgi:hypothetical protein